MSSSIASAESPLPVAGAPETDDNLSGRPDFVRAAILARRAQEAALEAATLAEAGDGAGAARSGSRNGVSVVFTLRLGHEEFGVLRGQAALRSIPPSVLARNPIRGGLKQAVARAAPAAGSDMDASAERVRSAAR